MRTVIIAGITHPPDRQQGLRLQRDRQQGLRPQPDRQRVLLHQHVRQPELQPQRDLQRGLLHQPASQPVLRHRHVNPVPTILPSSDPPPQGHPAPEAAEVTVEAGLREVVEVMEAEPPEVAGVSVVVAAEAEDDNCRY